MSRTIDHRHDILIVENLINDNGQDVGSIDLQSVTENGATSDITMHLANVLISNTTSQDAFSVSDVLTVSNINRKLKVHGRIRAQNYEVDQSSTNGQLLFSNAGVMEGAPIVFNTSTQETIFPGKLKVLGGFNVLGNVSRIQVENVVVSDPIFEIASNSLDGMTSGIVFQRPSGNIAISHQPDNTFNLSYTTGSAWNKTLPIDATKDIDVVIHGKLKVKKSINVLSHAANNSVLFSNAGVMEGSPITCNVLSNITTIPTGLRIGRLNINGSIYKGITYNILSEETVFTGNIEVQGTIKANISIPDGGPGTLLYNNVISGISSTTATFDFGSNETTFSNAVTFKEIFFLE